MNSKPNDCIVCAVINALQTIGIPIDRTEVEEATKYNNNGGFHDIGLHIISDKLNLKGEYYPRYDDITWVAHPDKKNVSVAPPELNKDKFFKEFKKRLLDGWVGVTSHKWESTDNYHAVALIGVENDKIKVVCSLKGIYLADSDLLLVDDKGRMNGLMSTYWVKK